MKTMMTAKEFIKRLQNIVDKYNTVYMWGVFGAPVTEKLIAEKTRQYPQWYSAARQAAFRKLIGKGYFGFDCVNVIKGIIWGWHGDATKSYGGAIYATNDVPDVSADAMARRFIEPSTDFSKILPGEAVWIKGHIGIYIGDGKVIECTPSWKNKVQVTACLNIGPVQGHAGRKWTNHGKLPFIEYENPKPEVRELTHAVVRGDNLSKIAAKYGVTVADIAKLNNITNVNIINIGQILKIPKK